MELLSIAFCLVITCLIMMSCVPRSVAFEYRQSMRRIVSGLIAIEFLLALLLGIAFVIRGTDTPLVLRAVEFTPVSDANIGVYYDGLTGLMLILVTMVGFVVSQFSIRYLDGEATQGQFFRWLGVAVGAVSLMVAAGNLLLFFAAWVLTSFALHHLLLHYPNRKEASRAAWTKFAISRLGDVFLICAFGLTFLEFGSFDLHFLFTQVEGLTTATAPTRIQSAISWLLVFGAITKSAQFPFHVWLPDTMETPTPVSALMHAGIVNAGGYLIIRLSPIVTLAPSSLTALAVIGTFTACFGGVVMMTQPSIKKSLAYSTIAQMGFMMLQCGLGAFSAAMLHIIAHSLYKAYAFLTSGSVVTHSGSAERVKTKPFGPVTLILTLVVAAVVTIASHFATASLLTVATLHKPGGLVLTVILCLAVASWGWRVLTFGKRSTTLIATVGMAGLCIGYLASYVAIDRLLQPTIGKLHLPSITDWALLVIVSVFAVLFTLQAGLRSGSWSRWLAPLRVHALNGFYIDTLYSRLIAAARKEPVH